MTSSLSHELAEHELLKKEVNSSTSDESLSKPKSLMISNSESNKTNTKHSNMEIFLFFLSACGATIPPNCLLSCLITYNWLYGEGTYILLNLCIFLPLIPISYVQSVYDMYYDRLKGSFTSFLFRGVVSYNFCFLIAIAPFISNVIVLLSLSFVIATFSACLQGSLLQMASFVSNSDQLKVAVSSGLIGSGILILIISLVTGFGRKENEEGKYAFFLLITIFELLCFFSFIRLMYTPLVRDAMNEKDSTMERRDHTLKIKNSKCLSEEEDDEMSKKSWPCCISMIITVAPQMAICSWFAQVKTDWIELPQILFFIRLFFDLLGRPASLFCDTSMKNIQIMSFARLCLTPLFFVASEMGNDALVIFLDVFFSFTCGYLVAAIYQVAPKLLTSEQSYYLSQQTGLLNTSLSISLVFGVVVSLSLFLFNTRY